jgi:hypothetical protein
LSAIVDRVSAFELHVRNADHVHVTNEPSDEQRAVEGFIRGVLYSRLNKRQKRLSGAMKVPTQAL